MVEGPYKATAKTMERPVREPEFKWAGPWRVPKWVWQMHTRNGVEISHDGRSGFSKM